MTEEEERSYLEDEICRIEQFLSDTNNEYVAQKIRNALPYTFKDYNYDLNTLRATLNMAKKLIGEE